MKDYFYYVNDRYTYFDVKYLLGNISDALYFILVLSYKDFKIWHYRMNSGS